MITLVVLTGGMTQPVPVFAHGAAGDIQVMEVSNEVDDIKLNWLAGKAPTGEANRTPMDWRMQPTKAGTPVQRAAYELDFVHLESGYPVLHMEGVTTDKGVIDLKYSPPDGTGYQLQIRAHINGRVYHLALMGEAEAIHPTGWRKWQSFLIMLVPLMIGMVWGWRRHNA